MIKYREKFRPFAAILEDKVSDFEIDEKSCFMEKAFKIKRDKEKNFLQ